MSALSLTVENVVGKQGWQCTAFFIDCRQHYTREISFHEN